MTTNVAAAGRLEPLQSAREVSQLLIIVRRFVRHRLALVSLFVMALIFLVSVFAPKIAPYGPTDIVVGSRFVKPLGYSPITGNLHILGTDQIGRDLFSRILYAARISLTVAITATILSELFGMIIGAISGYYRGWVDAVLMRFVEFMLTIPSLILLLVISAMLLANPGLVPVPAFFKVILSKVMLIAEREAHQAAIVIVVLTAFGWMNAARLMRGMVLSLREMDFTEALRALGASDARIIFRHMIPNALAPIIVDASLALGGFIVLEAALSFLGFGIQDPTPTWGNMLAAAQNYMFDNPWLPLIPGTPIFLCSLAFNYIGDGLRDALDPRLKR